MEHSLETEKMEAVKSLADTHMKISEAKRILSDLQENETEYLIEREKKAVQIIEKVMSESKALTNEIGRNYDELKSYYSEVSNSALFIKEIQEKFSTILNHTKEMMLDMENYAKEEIDRIADTRKEIELEWRAIADEKDSIKKQRLELDKERGRIESQLATLATNYKHIHNLWTKSK